MPSSLRKSIQRFAMAALLAAPALCGAQTHENPPIRLVIPYAVGGSMDVVGRDLAQKFQEQTGQTMIVDNRGGAAGLIGSDYVARSRPDGHTLLMATAAQITIAPALFKKLPYDPMKDLEPVTQLLNTSNLLVVSSAFPAHSVKELLSYARAHPGKLSYGSPGTGSVSHLAAALFAQRTGIEMLHVPYRGAAPALGDVAAGRISMIFTPLATARPLLDSGKVRALAIAAPARSASLPDVPTLAEAGVANADSGVWIGIMVPKGTPADVKARLSAQISRVLAAPDIRKRLADLGADVVADGPSAFESMIRNDATVWKQVISAGHIQLE